MFRGDGMDGWPIGRHGEMAAACAALAAGEHVVVTSAPAMGRSWFIRSLAASSRRPQLIVLADVGSREIAFGALAPLVSPPGRPLGRGPDALTTAAQRLLQAGGPTPPVVIVDDAHELDAHSSLVLAQAAGHGATLVVGVDRRSELPPALAALRRSGRTFDVELDELLDTDVAQLASSVLGGPVEPVMVRALTRLVGHAPAAIVEVLLAAKDTGAVRPLGAVWRQIEPLPLPRSVLHRVAALTSAFSREVLDLLDLVALGESVPLAWVDEPPGEDGVETLEARGLVVLDASQRLVAVADPAVRSVRLHEMASARRRRLARRLSEVQRRMPAVPADALLAARLAWYAGDPLGRAELLEAAREARRRGQIDFAEALCRTVVAEVVDVEASILLSELLTNLGRNREAERLLVDVAPAHPGDVALIAMTRAVNLAYYLDEVRAAQCLLDDAIDQVADEPWVAELIGLQGAIELMLGRSTEALDLVSGYLSKTAGRHFVEAATAAGPALVVSGRHLDAADLAQQAFDERVRLGDQPLLSSPGLHALVRSMGLAEAGRFAEADELREFVMAVAVELGDRDGQMWAGVMAGRSLLHQGRFPEALSFFEVAASAATDLNLVPHLRWARGGALLAIAQMGDAAGARRALDALDACPPTMLDLMSPDVQRARAWGAIATADVRGGLMGLVAAADSAREGGQLGLEIVALHDLVRINRVEHVERLLALDGQVQGELAAARVAHGAALAADDAAGLTEVSERFEALGAIVMAAEAANQASWVHRRAGAPRLADRERVRLLRLRAARPDAATPALGVAPGLAWLTAREREVATLAAAGGSSKDIASRLGVSVRTVDNLLLRVYRKLGVNGREALREAGVAGVVP
jgi:DNA-binding CsgD family transcriptional regulator/tetratricopeptide (TPR) repeat protein